MGSFNMDTVVGLVEPLSRPRYSPFLLLLLAYRSTPQRFYQAFRNLKTSQSPLSRSSIEAISELFLENLWTKPTSRWIKLYLLLSLLRAINRVGARLFLDQSKARKIVWKDHVVVISGAGRGIGSVVAQKIKKKGGKVAVIDKTKSTEGGHEDLFIECDVTQESQLVQARQQVIQELGYPTMIVSAAGIARHAFILDPPSVFPSEFSTKVVDVNLHGTYNFVKVFGQDMLAEYDDIKEAQLASKDDNSSSALTLRKEGGFPKNGFGGHILLMGSGAAFVHLPANATYNASKAGILAFHNTLGFELDIWHKARNVRNSIMCPLMIESAMTEGRMKAQKNQFMYPTLTVDQVAEKIMAVLESDRSQMVLMPRMAYVLSILTAVIPPWLMRVVAKSDGAHETFAEYATTNRRMVFEK